MSYTQKEITDLQELVGILQQEINLMIMRADLQSAHIENLIERVAELEKQDIL